jgi:hypothetical protein
MSEEHSGFPLYLMVVNGKNKWLSLYGAGVQYDNGFIPVSIGGRVLEEKGTEREITAEERRKIADIADEYSGSK